ncbi:MAG: phosphatidylserine decarboxylase [Candidatus Thermoplasmatota archaeon]|jgi:phosphatidylserine decarboxylase|nr:phosphatidylserine decarboxylase [Candidatus Thermoplasmatota archaeon]
MGLLAKGTPAWLWASPIVIVTSAMVTYLLIEDLTVLIVHLVFLICTIPLLSFFRDPEREIGEGIVSPADGKVRKIWKVGSRTVISIFMNVHNVHVNRAPMEGTIRKIEHISGGFVPAFDKGSDRNERVKMTLSGGSGNFEVVQIAGTVARRIVPYRSVGDKLEKGERFGLIRFGSRVDIAFVLPGGYKVRIKEGDKVLAGSTTLAAPPKKRGRSD